jgi:hypothetical protein
MWESKLGQLAIGITIKNPTEGNIVIFNLALAIQ